MSFYYSMFRISLYLSILWALVLFSSCDRKDSAIAVPIKIKRFDLDLKKFDTTNFEISEKTMIQKYGDVYNFYIEKLMGLGSLDPKNSYYYRPHLSRFLSEEYPSIMDTIDQYITPNVSGIEKELGICYHQLSKHFPETKPSTIYSFFISPMGANPAAAFSYGQDTIGFNWFNYLGQNFSLYKNLYEGYSYMIKWNQRDYLARNIMLVEYNLLREKQAAKELHSELIYAMIEKGKEFNYLDKICPDMKDAVKIGYTEAQMKWCEENEYEIWAYFKENKVLYSTEVMVLKRMTEEGPTTPGMPSESPGMVGAWTGWQIIKAYQSRANKPLKELLAASPKEILKQSNYKPKKQ